MKLTKVEIKIVIRKENIVMNKKGDLLNHSIIYKILSDILYLIAYPIIFILTKLWHGLKIEGRENLDKVGDEYIAVANHINMIDCAMVTLSIFPRIPYFLTLQSNLEIPIIKYLVMLFRGIPIPRNKSGKEKMVNTIDDLLQKGEVVGIYPEGELIPYYDGIREFKNGAFNFAVKNQVPILPIVFTYRDPEGIIKLIKKKPFITLTILEPEFPKPERTMANVVELKNRVQRKMRLEGRMKKLYNERTEKNGEMQEENV